MTVSTEVGMGPEHGSDRVETDSIGPIGVPADRLWGAQTQRSIVNFPTGRDRYVWGSSVIRALGNVKKAAALANRHVGVLDSRIAELIVAAADEVISGKHDDEFPLVVFQTGSGTQTNMNTNEVIANRANQLAGSALGSMKPVHPNDHVNASQSSNDVFPTVMHLATVTQLHQHLYPAVDALGSTLTELGVREQDVVKVGRTHLQDATPVTLGQEIEAWAAQIRAAIATVRHLEPALRKLAIGGTATGTGLNAPSGFAGHVIAELSGQVGIEFIETDNHFAATASHDPMVNISAALRTLAGAGMKMANDIRLLSSGPRNGIGEISIPANEPGSSIMPGKVNPTQAEALNMVAVHVFGNDAAVAFAGTQGELQLNVYKPLILHNTLDSISLLADVFAAFDRNCLRGLEPNRERITANLESNLMVVTALVPDLGYDKAATIAKIAQEQNISIRQAVTGLGYLTEQEYDRRMNPRLMTEPSPTP